MEDDFLSYNTSTTFDRVDRHIVWTHEPCFVGLDAADFNTTAVRT